MYKFFIFFNNIIGDYMYYISNFLLFSILGHLLESFIYLIMDSHNYSGIMYGPWTPVYGFGIIIIIVIYNFIKKRNINNISKVISIFLLSMIFLTFIEYIGGNLIEYFFHRKFWNYENLRFNIGSYIALEIAFVWGICSLIYIYILKPVTDKMVKKIPNYIFICILVFFIIDFVVTVINNLK